MSTISIKQSIRKINFTTLSFSVLFLVAIIFNTNQTIDTSSKRYVDKAFTRALITFGIAKTLNGVISVAQGTEIAIQPAGIGINLTPGQILDPVNDLIERFSWVMLASSTSLGIQKIFLTMSIWPAFNYIITGILIFGLFFIFYKKTKYVSLRIFILRLSLLLIALRFAVPITGIVNQSVYQVFLENEYITSTNKLEITADEIGQLNEEENFSQPNIKKKSVWESAKAFYKSTSEMLDINKKIEKYKQAATETTHHIVNLIVVFLFQTLIIPIAFIFFLYSLTKYIVRLKFEF